MIKKYTFNTQEYSFKKNDKKYLMSFNVVLFKLQATLARDLK